MSLLQMDKLGKSFGAQLLFGPFSGAISRGEKIALVGDNGVGKSTLLSIVAGGEKNYEGIIHRSRDLTIGYLPQLARMEQGATVYQAMLIPFKKLLEMEREMRALEKKMEAGDEADAMHRYDDLIHAFARQGGYEIEARIRAALAGVGFKPSEFDKTVSSLSGGEEARAALACVLAKDVDLLLLDEPTNHLDFSALDWLEEELLQFPGALMLVSHDRHLLDNVTNRTWEIAFGEINTYRSGYSASRELRNAQIAQRQELHDEQQATISRYKDFIQRHHAGQKHRQAKDRERKLARLEEQIMDAPRQEKKISLSIPISRKSGKKVLTLANLKVGYGYPLFSCPDLVLDRGETIAVIGENGCGKTSLLRTITGELAAFQGTIILGHGVKPVVYSQKQEGLHGKRTILDTILSCSDLTIGQARNLLGRFLFSGDDVQKTLDALSGGERSRVALAILSLMEGNLLLLDEPTNHLDLRSQEILEQALLDYQGTIILVSHDRALLEAVATQVWQVSDERLSVFRYGFSEYRRRVSQRTSNTEKVSRQKELKIRQPEAKGDKHRDKKKTEKLRSIEERIENTEAKLSEIEKLLVSASQQGNSEKIGQLGQQHNALKQEIQAQMQAWEDVSEESS